MITKFLLDVITFMTLRVERHVAFFTQESAPGFAVFLFSAIFTYTNLVFLHLDKVVVQSIIPDVIIRVDQSWPWSFGRRCSSSWSGWSFSTLTYLSMFLYQRPSKGANKVDEWVIMFLVQFFPFLGENLISQSPSSNSTDIQTPGKKTKPPLLFVGGNSVRKVHLVDIIHPSHVCIIFCNHLRPFNEDVTLSSNPPLGHASVALICC